MARARSSFSLSLSVSLYIYLSRSRQWGAAVGRVVGDYYMHDDVGWRRLVCGLRRLLERRLLVRQDTPGWHTLPHWQFPLWRAHTHADVSPSLRCDLSLARSVSISLSLVHSARHTHDEEHSKMAAALTAALSPLALCVDPLLCALSPVCAPAARSVRHCTRSLAVYTLRARGNRARAESLYSHSFSLTRLRLRSVFVYTCLLRC